MDHQKRKANHIMTTEREQHIRNWDVITLDEIMKYMDCSKYVAELYVNELKLKIDVITNSNRNTDTRNFRRKTKAKRL